jgi:hypothetical protein
MEYEELEGLTKFSTDFLDAYCYSEVGHTNWSYVDSVHPDEVADGDIKTIIVIYKDDDREEDDKL